MTTYEYKVIPTPRRPRRAKGVKGEPARFANVLTDAINEIAVDGWEFVRSETLPMEAKTGLFSRRQEVFQSVIVFRRQTSPDVAEAMDEPMAEPEAPAEVRPVLTAIADPGVAPSFDEPATPQFAFHEDAEREVMEQAAAEPEAAPEDIVAFDAEELDPLKTVVEEHRSRTGSE